MNLTDLFILAPIAYFAYKGFVSGFIKEALGIIGIILAIYITFEYMKPVSAIFGPLFENPDHATIAAGILLFISTVAVVQFIAFSTKKFLELLKINFINRLAGLCFGILKSSIVVSAILLLLAGFNMPGEEARENSLSYPFIIFVAPAAFDIIATMVPEAENFIVTIEQAIEENNPIRTLPIFDE